MDVNNMDMNINWYPGHMKKTRESIQKNLIMIDIVYELLDARIPYSSRNPVIDELVINKPRIVILNKADMSSPAANKKWQIYFSNRDIPAVLLNSLSGKGLDELIDLTKNIMAKKRVNNAAKGIIHQPIRAMILGIPNVGKSTLINSIAKRKSAKTGNRPGITKTNQWIKTKGGIELLDTPGILWPKFEDPEVGLNLAFTGAIKEEILDSETLALRLVERLSHDYPSMLVSRYSVDVQGKTGIEIIDSIAVKRGCILRAGEIDYEKTSRLILDEFRKGVLGKIALEFPKDVD